jgi:dihydroxyacetone kinase
VKKLINNPLNAVRETLEGLVDTSDHLALLEAENAVINMGLPAFEKRPVAILSGGGSGHEPAHAAYVGPGMLTAAVAGDVFTSPSVDSILATILACAGPNGILLIVKNYTGDRLNFALAAELARGQGIPAEIVVVADDVSLEGIVPLERRRGIAGTVLVHKVAGAAASEGLPLRDVAHIAQIAASCVATMGVGLSSCTVPAVGHPTFELPEEEIEFGLGIHGEKGVRRSPIQPADIIVDEIIELLLADLSRRGFSDGRLVLLVNGLGATPPMELSIVARRALSNLRARGWKVERVWVGDYLTAIDMAGCSLTLMPVDDRLLTLLDAPAHAAGWTSTGMINSRREMIRSPTQHEAISETHSAPASPIQPQLSRVLGSVINALKDAEPLLTDLDTKSGDGDLGFSMTRGAESLLALPPASTRTAELLLSSASGTLRRAIAGSSGPLYAIALARAARILEGVPVPNDRQWYEAFSAAVDAVAETGGARRGDRTMLDALLPAIDAWGAALDQGDGGAMAFRKAVEAADHGAQESRNLLPRLGRASYLGERAKGVPDAGAVAVVVWMKAIAQALQ